MIIFYQRSCFALMLVETLFFFKVQFCLLPRFEMLEGKMAFDNPPLPGQELPHCTAKGWNSYGGTLSNVWRQLMSTPTAKQSLSIVGNLDSYVIMMMKLFKHNQDHGK